MTKGAPLGHLFFYAVPLLLGNWLQLAYNAVDSIIAGRFIGQDAPYWWVPLLLKSLKC